MAAPRLPSLAEVSLPPTPRTRGLNRAVAIVAGGALMVLLGAAAAAADLVAGLAVLAALGLLVLLRMRQWPLLIMLVLLSWMPVQNAAIALLVSGGHIAASGGQVLTAAKEVVVLGVLGLLVATGRMRRWRMPEIFFAIYLVWILSYLPRGSLPLTAQLAGLRMLAIPPALFLLGRYLPAPPAAARPVLATLLAVMLMVCAAGWVEWLMFDNATMARLQAANAAAKGQELARVDDLLDGAFYTAIGSAVTGDIVWVRRMISSYLEPLSLGHALILPLAFAFYALAGERPAPLRPRWLAAVVLAVLGLTQAAAFSRGALLGSAVAVTLIALMHRRARTAALVFIALAMAAAAATPRARTLITNTLRFEDPSTIAHVQHLVAGWQLTRERPLGLGLGYGGYVLEHFAGAEVGGVAESYYFSAVSQVGVVGAGLFMLGTLSVLKGLVRVARRAGGPWSRAGAYSAAGALAGYSLSAVFSEAAFGMLACAAVWLLAGLVMQQDVSQPRPVAGDVPSHANAI